MSSESSENAEKLSSKNADAAIAAEELHIENTVNDDTQNNEKKTVPFTLSEIKLKEEAMMKRIAEMEAKKAEILGRIKQMEEIGAKTEKLRQEKLVKIAKAQEREALLKTENEKLGLRKPKTPEEEAIFNRIVELESRKRAILDRIEDIEKVKSKGLEYKERAEKLRQKLEEKRQQQLNEQKEISDKITVSTENSESQMADIEEAVKIMNLTAKPEEKQNE